MKVLLVILSFLITAYAQKFTICAYNNKQTDCASLERGSSEIACVPIKDSVECALKIANGTADFGVFSAEQSHLISSFINTNHMVIGEARARVLETRNSSISMVVVVRNSHTNGLQGLRNKKYCHPGMAYHSQWSPRLRKEFENMLLNDVVQKTCTSKKNSETFVEDEIKELANFFGDSCRPGYWSKDDQTESLLKRKYSKLCRLCDNSGSCTYTNENDEDNSIRCLQKGADVAYTTLESARKLPVQEYKLLCRNGILSDISLNVRSDCFWQNQPWPLIVANRQKATNIQRNLRQWIDNKYLAVTIGAQPFVSTKKLDWYDALAQMLTDNGEYGLNFLEQQNTIEDYLHKNGLNVDVPKENIECSMKWCTISSDEQYKCEWIGNAVRYAGIKPQISCIIGDNVYDCLNKIRHNNADIMSINSNYGYLARKAGVNNVLYSETVKNDAASIVALVPSDSSIQKFEDLKGKKACFPEFRGLAWVSFVEIARQKKLIRNNCDFGKSISEFFESSCAPGASDDLHYRNATTNYPKLCALCPESCDSHKRNTFFGDTGALNCLNTKMADVAFVEVEALNKANVDNLDHYTVLCPNGETIRLNNLIDKPDCVMSRTVDSEIIARNNDTSKADYKETLLWMDELFGKSSKLMILNVFDTFNNIENLMFKDNVLGFDDGSSGNKDVENYIELFKKIDECTSNSWMTSASVLTLLISLFVLISSTKIIMS